jgi:hypothetical protein
VVGMKRRHSLSAEIGYPLHFAGPGVSGTRLDYQWIVPSPCPEVVSVSSSRKLTALQGQFIFTSSCHVFCRPHTTCTYPPAPIVLDVMM